MSELAKDLASDRANAKRDIIVGKVAELLEQSGIPVEEVGRINKVRLSTSQSLTKDKDGEAHVHDLTHTQVVLSPKWAEGPEWPVVQPARPVLVKPPVARKLRRKHKIAVILPDTQIGYRTLDGALEPFHDEAAMKVALAIAASLDPDLVVNLGDFIDLPSHSRFVQEPAFAQTTQAALNRGHRFLGEQKAAAPHAELVLLEGNHDLRLTKSVLLNATASFGLKRANLPDSWPVLSVPNLLRLDELGVTYVGGYPAGEFWINDRLVCVHGSKVRSGSSTAAAVARDEYVSQIFGHIHRSEEHTITRRSRSGPVEITAMSPGCLCRIDGAVPSVKSGLDVHGKPVTSYEDWQQGIAVVTYTGDDFDIERVRIRNGRARFRGEEFSC